MSKISFNLLEEPWIPCEMKSKESKLLSIKNVLFQAREILDITSDNPLIVVSIYRLLLAILHRNFGPKNRNGWKEIYEEGKWDKNVLEEYFKKWEHRFELFNEPENRFYQMDISETIKNETPIRKLNLALSSGHNTSLFDHNWDSEITPLSIENVAQILVAFQNFAVGGGKSVPYNYSHAPLISSIIALLKGNDLFETLMLNFIRYDQKHPFEKSEDHEDIPFWERDKKLLSEDKDGRFPYGYLDYLTWQSRRIWLVPILYDGNIKVKYVYLAQGEKVKQEWNWDPQMVYKVNKENKTLPLKLDPDRHVWRDAESLLRINDSDSKNRSPAAINWVSTLTQTGIIDLSRRYNLEIYGLCNDPKKAAKIISWHRSHIPLPLKLLEDQSLIDNVKTFIGKCEKIEQILSKTIQLFAREYLFPGVSSLSTNQWNSINDFIQNHQIRTKYWNLVENFFYKFMEEIVKEPDFEKRIEIIKIWINDSVLKTAQKLLNSIKVNIKNDPRALKPFIQTEGYFLKHTHDLNQ